MSRYYINPNNIKSSNRRNSRLKKRRRMLSVTAVTLVFLIAVVYFGFGYLHNLKSKPAEAPLNQGQVSIGPPAVTADPQPSGSANGTSSSETKSDLSESKNAQSPSVSSSQPVKSAGDSSSAAVGSLDKAAKPLWIKVSIAKQNVTVYDANNEIVKSFVCSTGLDGADTETPVGTYKIAERGESFFSDTYQEGGYYWTQFYGDYLFHSVPFDKNRNIEATEAAKLGTKASHGCVRLSIENAKWIYDNIPRGTKVVVE